MSYKKSPEVYADENKVIGLQEYEVNYIVMEILYPNETEILDDILRYGSDLDVGSHPILRSDELMSVERMKA